LKLVKASMLNEMPRNIKIYGTTAATADESSYATYWDDNLQTYLGDEYSVAWMEDSEAYWDGDAETLLAQFTHVKSRVNHSHPQIYGDRTKEFEKVRHFQDETEARRNLDSSSKARLQYSDARDVVLNTLKNRALLATDPMEFLKQRKLIEQELSDRNSFETIFKTLALALGSDDLDAYVSELNSDNVDDSCLKTMYPHFESKCMKWSAYGMKYVTAIVNFCNDMDTATIQEAMTQVCGNYFGRSVINARL